jgi:carboxyl-terminal processing protease
MRYLINKSIPVIAITFWTFINYGCEKIFFEDDPTDTPENNFEIFWSDFNKFYPFFEIKNIDWDSIYTFYRPKITNNTNRTELLQVFTGMIKLLEDYHVKLVTEREIVQSITFPSYEEYYSAGRIYPQKYLNSFQSNQQNLNYWSVINSDIGYISINTFGTKGNNPFVFSDNSFLLIDKILEEFKNKEGIIIDLRWNAGGYPSNVETIVNRFADRKRLYLKVCSKNGTGRKDFSDWIDYYIEPEGLLQFNKPIVVLTSRLTGSAAEWFTLAFKTLPFATTIGDTTAGGFSPQITRELPNGWSFCLSTKIVMSADKKIYEGIGIPTDIPVQNKKTDFDNKRDAILEKAIEIIKLKIKWNNEGSVI